jgi:hypothetical protein
MDEVAGIYLSETEHVPREMEGNPRSPAPEQRASEACTHADIGESEARRTREVSNDPGVDPVADDGDCEKSPVQQSAGRRGRSARLVDDSDVWLRLRRR